MEFRILGPLQVHAGQVRLSSGGPREQKILAVLLLGANRVVPVERLIEAVWDTAPPATSRNQVRNRIGELRRLWAPHAADGALVTEGSGYLLHVGPDQLDLTRVERDVSAARDALRSGDDRITAARLLRAALGEWRGPALSGVGGRVVETAAARLDDLRLTLMEECVGHELALGRHRHLVDELSTMVAEHPFREQLVGHLMLALYRSGRRADALAGYHRCARLLADELGIDPGPELRRLHEEILLRDGDPEPPAAVPVQSPAPAPPPAPAAPVALASPAAPGSVAVAGSPVTPVPAELPADVADFTGRARDIGTLDALLGGERPRTAVAIGIITGTAGVGKTALAVHWAHRVAARFPDGQLYVDLRGYAQCPPQRPIDVLASMLRALGVAAEQVPIELDEASRLFRSLVADRRMLVVLDNATSAEQVRPLLPGGASCLVLVTSRDRLAGLMVSHGARRLTLDVLGADEAVDLLGRILGEEPMVAEPRATADLVQACAYLPLALRIAAANLAIRPHRSIAEHVAELHRGDRFAALRIDGDSPAVHTVFDVSYAALRPDTRRMFRLLGLVPGPDVTTPAAAELAGVPPAEAATLLDRLAAAHLVDQRLPGRYAFHDLLRLYARQRCDAEETPAEREAALRRLFDWYVAAAASAASRLYPHMLRLSRPGDRSRPPTFDTHGEAASWLDAERANLVAAVGYAAAAGPYEAAWLLADALRGYFWLRGLTVEWLATGRAGVAAATDRGEPRGQAAAEISLAFAHYSQGRYDESIEHYRTALRLSEESGWPEGEATALGNIGLACTHTGDLRGAEEHLTRALAIDRTLGRRLGLATNLRTLGQLCVDLGRPTEALRHLDEALGLYRDAGSRSGEAVALSSLGQALRILGRHDEAMETATLSLRIYREIGDPDGEAFSLDELACLHHDAGRRHQALRHAIAALSLARRTGRRRVQGGILNTLGQIRLGFGCPRRAAGHHRRALAVTARGGSRRSEVEAHIGLAAALGRHGDSSAALRHARRALDLAQRSGYKIMAGTALTTLAGIYMTMGDTARAAESARQAAGIHTDAGYRVGAARTQIILRDPRLHSAHAAS